MYPLFEKRNLSGIENTIMHIRLRSPGCINTFTSIVQVEMKQTYTMLHTRVILRYVPAPFDVNIHYWKTHVVGG